MVGEVCCEGQAGVNFHRFSFLHPFLPFFFKYIYTEGEGRGSDGDDGVLCMLYVVILDEVFWCITVYVYVYDFFFF